MAFRAALHPAGAAALSHLLQFPEPATDQRAIPCPCGSQAHYRELRWRRMLTAWGAVELTRPWYLCPRCHHGQFPVDRPLDIENRGCSPGVRRLDAIGGQPGPFALRRWLAREILDNPQPERDPQYRAWIRSQPCAACGTHIGVEAAHTGPHGLGQKASDYTCIPLCYEHHRTGNEALDKIGHQAFQDRYFVNSEESVRRFNALWRNRQRQHLALEAP
jgi:hypothetical protein